MIWWVVDFPISFLAEPLERYMGGFPFRRFGDIGSSLILAVFFAIFGGIQYYLIGFLISKTILSKQNARGKQMGQVQRAASPDELQGQDGP